MPRDVEEGFGTAINLSRFFSHSQEISISTGILAQICGMGEKERQVYSTTGLMHDVGRDHTQKVIPESRKVA
ncbi:MAG: hypothetical protein A2Y07_06700 [Planctomycetes bacterium GWF2_50_10]|nr:MAG: hypothetical protein A2Y07_06700 [Planctomycetes bacterium GWF2_50_10]